MNTRETVMFFAGLVLLSNLMGYLVYALVKWEQ